MSVWTTYGSYKNLEAPSVEDAVKIVAFDTLYSFLAGIAIFSVVGYLRASDFPLDSPTGMEMNFVLIPSAIAMTADNAKFWCAGFYFCLFFISLDS